MEKVIDFQEDDSRTPSEISKIDTFNKWCQQEGVIAPKLEYPKQFEFGLHGIGAKEDIAHREAFLFIPFKMLLTLSNALNHPQMGRFFKTYPKLFSKLNDDSEQLTLAMFMYYEFLKGKDSYWFPYLDLLPDVKFFCNWDQHFLLDCDDLDLMEESC